MKNTILTVATLKGGSGKSTVASSLAVHWRLAGRDPALVDADPQRSLARLAARERRLGDVPVIEAASPDLGERARALAARHDPVIIDTAGFSAAPTLAALAAADLVVVPVKPSPLDVDVMTDTAQALFRLRGTTAPPFYCLLSQTVRDSVIARHIRGELAAAGFPMLTSELPNRVIYAEAALFGASPSLIQPHGAAAADIAALAAEIEGLLATAEETPA